MKHRFASDGADDDGCVVGWMRLVTDNYLPDDPRYLAITTHSQRCGWYPATVLPGHNDVVWGFCPARGNEDEGYGEVLVVRYEPYGVAPGWYDCRNRPIHITRWASLRTPAVPAEWVMDTPPDKEDKSV